MASNNRSSGTAALRYASALIDMAVESGVAIQVEKDLADLRVMLAGSSDLQNLMKSPLFSVKDQQAALTALADAAKFSGLTKNFLLTLAQNRRLSFIDDILKAIAKDISRRKGELTVNVQVAYDLSAAHKKSLEQEIGKAVGQKVVADVEVKSDLIGGMIVTVGSIMIDDSIKHKLERLSRAMKYQSNQNQTHQEEVA